MHTRDFQSVKLDGRGLLQQLPQAGVQVGIKRCQYASLQLLCGCDESIGPTPCQLCGPINREYGRCRATRAVKYSERVFVAQSQQLIAQFQSLSAFLVEKELFFKGKPRRQLG